MIWLVNTEYSSSLYMDTFQPLSTEHALNCKRVDFLAIRRFVTSGHHCFLSNDDTCLDVAVYGLWGSRFEKALIDVRLFNPSASIKVKRLHYYIEDMS